MPIPRNIQLLFVFLNNFLLLLLLKENDKEAYS